MDWEATREAVMEWLEREGPGLFFSVVKAVAILLVGWLIAKAIRSLLRRGMTRAKVDATLVAFVVSIVYVAALAFVVVATLSALGVATSSFVAVIGAAGLAIAFALQGSLSNLASGVMLIMFRPFRAGHYVEAGGESGIVEEVQMFHTVLRTPDNKTVIIPNSEITSNTITNFSAKPTRRVEFKVGIAYEDDTTRAREILVELMKADQRVLADPAPMAAVAGFGDSSVNLVARAWVNSPEFWDVTFAINEEIKKAFDERGVTIPFPQRDIHIIRDRDEEVERRA